MSSISAIGTSPQQVQSSQPFLTKRGLALQDKSGNPSPEAGKAATQEIDTRPQTAIDVKA